MNKLITALSLGVLTASCLLAVGCKKNDQPVNDGSSNFYQPAPAPTPTPTPTPTPAPAPAPAAATEVASNGLMAAAGTTLLVPLQQQSAPNARQVGETLAGLLQQGQFMKTSVQLQPGKCYTGIGQGSGGPVVVELVAQVGNVVMATSQPGIISVLGEKATCFKNPAPLPVPVFFRVTAQGPGPVTAALYEK